MEIREYLLIAGVAVACSWGSLAVADPITSMQQEAKVRVLGQLERRVRDTGKSVTVIVQIDDQGAYSPGRPTDKEKLARAQDEVLARLGDSVSNVIRYSSLPLLAYTVNSDGLAQMRQQDTRVLGVQENKAHKPSLAQSVPLINAPTAWGKGYTGDGQIVAVIDTGVDRTHAFLSGKLTRNSVALEACTSNEWPSDNVFSTCPNGDTSQTGVGAAAPCADADQCAHGTHVAGIVAGKNASMSGVAPDAKIFAVQATSEYHGAEYCGDGPDPCYLFADANAIWALDFLHTLKTEYSYPIASVNMSFGGGQFFSNCDMEYSPYTTALKAVRDAGIAPVVASGNNGYTNSINFPGCISHAVSVGSICDSTNASECPRGANSVVDSSNIYPYLSLLAPGAWINSSVPGGTFQNWTGTSMATPHVAGVFALLRERNPQATVSQMLTELRTNAANISDARPGGSATGLKKVNLAYLAGGSMVDTRIKMNIDEPIANSIMTGKSAIRGWAVGPDGIDHVDYYIDGVKKWSIPYGGKRADIGSANPGMPNSTYSGFAEPFNFSSLAAGKHTVKIRAVGKTGKYKEASASFNIVKFHSAFFPNQTSMDLSAATLSKSNGKILVNNAKMDGKLYNLQLQWLKTPQNFSIVSIQKK